MRKTLFLLFALVINFSAFAQGRKLLVEINSINTKEVISLKYNSKNQLVYFVEKGIATYSEYTLKYDKATERLSECVMNQDKGELVTNSKYIYADPSYIVEELKSSGKKLHSKITEFDTIRIDDKGRLTKTKFDDGKLWEEFQYDDNNNLVKYIVHSATGGKDRITDYEFDANKSVFSNIVNMPTWFWALHMNKMRWCSDFIGSNSAIASAIDDPRWGINSVEITYDYDNDGYPVKQYYDDELVKEFKYKDSK